MSVNRAKGSGNGGLRHYIAARFASMLATRHAQAKHGNRFLPSIMILLAFRLLVVCLMDRTTTSTTAMRCLLKHAAYQVRIRISRCARYMVLRYCPMITKSLTFYLPVSLSSTVLDPRASLQYVIQLGILWLLYTCIFLPLLSTRPFRPNYLLLK